jgi:protein-S-isoprenylcysteine O-methyltransferase Ste14
MDRELLRIRVRTLGWLALPLVVVVAVPAWLRGWAHEAVPARWGVWQWVGAWLIANGLGLGGWCVSLLMTQGRGAPIPWHPPQRLVAAGPYRGVRNPMMWGLVLILAGQAVLFESRRGLAYTAAVILLIVVWVRGVEEPQLRRRFGQAYAEYCRQVPRWVPRLPARRKSD